MTDRFRRVIDILAARAAENGNAPIEVEISADTRFDAIGFDSLDVVAVALDVEIEFGLDFADDALEALATVDDLCRLLEAQPAPATPPTGTG